MAIAGYMLPGLAAAVPALRGPLGIEDRTASGRGYALTFDDGPHAQGTPAVLELLAGAGVQATFFLVGEQIERNPSLAARDRRGRAPDRPALPPPSQPAAPDAAAGARGHRSRGGGDRGRDRPHAGALPPALRRAQRGRAAPGPRARLAHAAVEPLGARLGGARDAESIAARVTDGAGEGAVLLLHDADDYSAAGSWRRTGRRAAAGPGDARRARASRQPSRRDRGAAPRDAVALARWVTSIACPAPFRSTRTARPPRCVRPPARSLARRAHALVGRAAGDRLAALSV